MWCLMEVVLLVLLQTPYLVYSANITENKRENCTDPNAELRFDNASCIVTCDKKALSENPDFCYGKPDLKEDCYCKQNYYLDETTDTCIPSEKCPCNGTANEISRFYTECANNCATFHTLTYCSNLLYSQCWCKITYCKNDAGKCVPIEI